MARLRHFVVALALFAGVGVFISGPASGDPSPPVQVAANGWENSGTPVGAEFDPAVSTGNWNAAYATCEKLLNYPDLPAPAGDQLQPDAAVALPTISPDKLTYTFTIRPGLGFSGSSGEQVSASSFVLAIERFEKLSGLNPGYQNVLDTIQGAAAYRSGGPTAISGLTASGDTLTIQLTQPDPVLPAKLTLPFFCAVPSTTPVDSLVSAPLASAAPYYVASVTRDGPTNQVTGFDLLRNPNYGGSRPATLPELDYTVTYLGMPSDLLTNAVAGAEASPPTTDWVESPPNRSGLNADYGSGSAPASAGQQQYFQGPDTGTQFLVLNTLRPGLDNVLVRKAINYAIDRSTAASLFLTDPTDQVTPPSFPGFVDDNIYPFTSDIATARDLMTQAGYSSTNPLSLTVLVQNGNGARMTLMNDAKTWFADIYINLSIVTMPPPQVIQYVQSNPTGYDMVTIGWLPDFVDGGDIVGVTFDPSRPDTFDWSHFDGPAAFPTDFNYAYSLDPGSARDSAWVSLDDEIMRNAAPLVPLAGIESADFFSTRVGCQVYNPVYGIDVGRLCERVPIAAGGTYSTAAPTASSPIQTTITSPFAGSVAVTNGATSQDVSGYDLLGTEVSIEAPTASTANPLTLVFDLDSSLLASQGATADTVSVLRNDVALPDCNGSNIPCVSSRTTLANGDAEITVLTDHASTWDFGVRDTTPPTLNAVALSANPVTPGNAVTLNVGASSDAVAAEFFIDHDNGVGLNLPLEGGAGSFTTPPFGSTLAVGAHTLGIRVRDRAHNWSPVQTIYLVVSNDPSAWVSAGGSLGPDKAAIAFHARYRDPSSPPDGDLTFVSSSFSLQSHSLDWLLADTSSVQLQGTGTIAGSDGTVRFRVSGTTGGHVDLRVWPASADPDTAPPEYQASGDLRGGQIDVHG